jgi:taurine dioxygenase
MAAFTVENLRDDLSFGAIVRGVTWDVLADEASRSSLKQLFIERGLLIFKGMEPSAKMQVALSKVFGPLKDHPTKTTPRDEETGDDEHGVIDMHYDPANTGGPYDGGLVRIDGEVLTRYSPWHFDHCYNDELNYAGVLRCAVAPPERGRTGFMDGIECYRQFPAGLRAAIEGINVIYTLDTRLSRMRYGVNFELASGDMPIATQMLAEVATFPRAMHPAVWTRPTGEKVMHVGGWMAFGLEHHEDEAGDALLDAVCHQVNAMGHGTSAYWHDWETTDMLIWDNHRMVHAVEGCDPRYERHTIRTTIQGDYGLGYFEDGKKIGEVYREEVFADAR